LSDFGKDCTNCGDCIDACPFLKEFGTPLKIAAQNPEKVFYCTTCRRCESTCPLNLSPAEFFLRTKEKLIRANQLSAPVAEAIRNARAFAGTGHRFPFSFYDAAQTVFWPGCGLAANRPGLVRKLKSTLSKHLRRKVGLVLDCCYDPLFGLGDTQTTFAALKEINKRLLDSGVEKIITGCLNCHKLLSEHLQDLEVVFILEVLPVEVFEKQNVDEIYLHHPCPASRWDRIHNAAQGVINHVNSSGAYSENYFRPVNSIVEASESLCCGLGAGVNSFAPEMADRFLDQITHERKNRTIVTYCTGCQNRFLQRGIKAVHLLEFLSEEDPRRTVPSPVGQWLNRLALATSARLMRPKFQKRSALKFDGRIIPEAKPSGINVDLIPRCLRRGCSLTSKFMIMLAIALLIAGGVYLNQQGVFSADVLKSILARHRIAAPVIFLLIYAIAPALFLPSIPITLAAGFFWGPLWGVIFSITGATIGACLPFFLSRYLLQDFIRSKISNERWQWLQNKVDQHGWKAVAFTRLIPVFPFNLLNYLFGLTPIAFVQYLWSTFVFMLPACIAFVAFGSSLSELIVRGNIKGVIMGIFIAAVAFLIPVLLRPFFRKIADGKGNDNT